MPKLINETGGMISLQKKNVLSSRYEMNRFVVRWMVRGMVAIFLYAGAVSIVHGAERWWTGVVNEQKELKEKAEYIAWQHIPVAHASEPLPYVPDTLKAKEDYQGYLGTLVRGKLYEEIVKVIDCETAGTWSADIQSKWRYKHGKMKNKQELSFGLSQIHLPAHPDVSREEATDAKFALRFIAENYAEHKDWWSCSKLVK